MEPRKLKTLGEIELKPQTAEMVHEEILSMIEEIREMEASGMLRPFLEPTEQIITVEANWFLMSGIGWLRKPLGKFKGYIGFVKPNDLSNSGEVPTAEMSIEITEVLK